MKTKQDYNSTTNQEIKEKFVRKHVLTCFSYEMDAILKASYDSFLGNATKIDFPTYENIENGHTDCCRECRSENLSYDRETKIVECLDCKESFDEMDTDSQPKEIYEWWIVSEFLYKKLIQEGEAGLEWGNNCYWGRCTTGQAILLDSVISKICSDMGILDGQEYSWANIK